MSDTSYGPWEQEEGSDVDEQKSGSGDSHEAEDEDVYPEQQPHGDPDRPGDDVGVDRFQADIDFMEEMARLAKIARPFDPQASVFSDAATYTPLARPYNPDASLTSDAATYNPFARPFDPEASSSSDAAAHNPFADELADSSSVSLSSHLTSPDPDEFDRVESADHVGPPTPGSASSGPSFDPAYPLADAFGDGSVSPLVSSDRFDPDESYQPAIVDPGPSFDPAVPFADAFGESSVAPSSPLISSDRFEADESYQAAIVDEPDVASSPSFAPEAEFRPDIPEETDWNHFIG